MKVSKDVEELEKRAAEVDSVKQRAAVAATKMREALQILEGLGPTKRTAGVDIREGRVFRPGYVNMTVAILRAAGEPLSPAQIRDEMIKDIPGVRRDALERQFYNEMRKGEPRLMQPRKGLYWIKGVPVPDKGKVSQGKR